VAAPMTATPAEARQGLKSSSMSNLTLILIKIAYLAVLWLFVLMAVGVIRTDLIGRAPDSSLVITDDYASGRHARVYSENGRWFVEDLNSTNGTYLGQQKLNRPQPITVGQPIRIGKTVLELRK
jgi:pSer/pThr/pTyr-binding forkhead associated (FHA) protein